ncbi:hypothetical protein SLA2020_459210 [Shorea laevis]
MINDQQQFLQHHRGIKDPIINHDYTLRPSSESHVESTKTKVGDERKSTKAYHKMQDAKRVSIEVEDAPCNECELKEAEIDEMGLAGQKVDGYRQTYRKVHMMT